MRHLSASDPWLSLEQDIIFRRKMLISLTGGAKFTDKVWQEVIDLGTQDPTYDQYIDILRENLDTANDDLNEPEPIIDDIACAQFYNRTISAIAMDDNIEMEELINMIFKNQMNCSCYPDGAGECVYPLAA